MERLYPSAPALQISEWINAQQPLSLEGLRGRIVAIHAFQMLCPGCVSHGLPQAKAIYEMFPDDAVAVIGLHSVFEHHEAMTPAALRAFLSEYRIRFPVGIDRPSPSSPVPQTMAAYALQGTPSLILIDKVGRIRLKHFGQLSDLRLGALIGQLVQEPAPSHEGDRVERRAQRADCDSDACLAPDH